MKILRVFFLAVLTAIPVFALSGLPSAGGGEKTSILPTEFSGWSLVGAAQASKDPAVADPVNAAVLKEYGFTDLNSAVYKRDDGRKLTLKAARFQDASGA